jgi:methyl-accepting chemotaxis protein
MLVLAIGFLCQACISIAFLPTLRQSLIRDRTAEVNHLDEAAYSLAAYYYHEAQAGRMTDAAARKAAGNAIRAMRYDGKNYFFAWSLDGTGIAHGAHPEWEGQRFIDSAVARKFPGVSFMVAQLIATAKSPAQQGVTTYQIPKFGQTKPLDKIAYSRLFEPWGWSIGTGAYVNDIDATFGSSWSRWCGCSPGSSRSPASSPSSSGAISREH